MGTVSNIGFPSVFRVPLDSQQALSKQMKNKSSCCFMVPHHSLQSYIVLLHPVLVLRGPLARACGRGVLLNPTF